MKLDQINENIVMESKRAVQIFTTTLLSLLLPLSFLLLARISTARYLFSLSDFPATEQPGNTHVVFFSLLKSIPLSPLHVLVSLICVASLIHSLNGGRNTFLTSSASPETATRPRLYTAWIVLCTLQVGVGLGIEGSIGAGIDGTGFYHDRSLLCRIVFLLGLHATTVYWSRMVVKPVVDDTMFGFEMEERWVERMVMGVSFGGLWWWRLRDEVESLVAVAEMKSEMMAGVGVGEFVGWWLYYLVVTIGMVRVVKGVVWFGMVLLCRKVEVIKGGEEEEFLGVEEKV